MPYKLYKSMTNDKSYKTTINESYFDICRFYFFINSEGSLCKAFEGQKPHADKWRKMVNNYFETEEECREMINKINEPDKKVKFIFEWIK